MKPVNKVKSFLPIACITFALLFACENPWMAEIVQEKTITFNSNGGSHVPSQKLYVGERVKEPAAPKHPNGLTFLGWYEDNESFKKPYNFDFIPTHSMTLYAEWWDESKKEIKPDDLYIRSVEVQISGPATGEIPFTDSPEGGTGYICSSVTWDPYHDKFQGDTIYTASVTLTAIEDHIFSNLIDAKINGQIAHKSIKSENLITLSYTFAKTDSKIVANISIEKQPNLMYDYGEKLDLTNLVVKLTYNDGTDISVTFIGNEKNISASPSHGDSLSVLDNNAKTVVVSYGSLKAYTDVLEVNMADLEVVYFEISGIGTFIYNGSPKLVSVKPKQNYEEKGMGSITVYYTGTNGTTYNKINAAPSNVGIYTVTFNVSEGANYKSAEGLSVGTLTINKATPTVNDFDIIGTGTFTHDGNNKTVSVTGKSGITGMGTVTVYYTGTNGTTYNKTNAAPSNVGTYNVTFEVADGTNYKQITNLSAGTLTINKALAQVNGTNYDNIAKAITAVIGSSQNNPAEIKILEDINADNTGYTILNGKHIKLTVEEGYTRTITAPAVNVSLFTVETGASLTLGNEGNNNGTLILAGKTITQIGHRGVRVNGGNLVINSNVTIKDFKTEYNDGSGNDGGGVYVNSGTFTLNGGTIENCKTYSGGGVYVNSGTFTMKEGYIHSNNATNGGGVCVRNGGTFNMSGGTIGSEDDPNKANIATPGAGGGVFVYPQTTFNMSGGKISFNKATTNGGGVYMDGGGTFTMSNGAIIQKNSANNGGGVYTKDGTFTMSDNAVIQNNAGNNGGGVFLFTLIDNKTIFTMNGGTILSNEAKNNGGGVYVEKAGFIMSGGTIYGTDGGSKANTVLNEGAAVYVNSGTANYVGDYLGYNPFPTSPVNNTIPQTP